MARLLEARGYRTRATLDLTGLASKVGGGDVDLTASRFAAVAAGLGEIGRNGIVLTPQFGPRQRFICLTTNAELPYDEVYRGPALCRKCGRCFTACPAGKPDRD